MMLLCCLPVIIVRADAGGVSLQCLQSAEHVDLGLCCLRTCLLLIPPLSKINRALLLHAKNALPITSC